MLRKNNAVKVNRWKNLLAPWRGVDWLLLLLPLGLTLFGGVIIRSTQGSFGDGYYLQHWLMGLVGTVLALAIARCRYESLVQWRWAIFALTNLALLAVEIAGVTALGAQRWISIGGFHVQPSEFAKLGMIVTIAALLHERPATTLPSMMRTLVITGIPWTLVFIQPDLGTSLVFGAVVIGMLYWGDAEPSWLVLLVSPLVAAIAFSTYIPAWVAWAAAMGAIAWQSLPWPRLGGVGALSVNLAAGVLGKFFWNNILHDYQRDRLISFLDPYADPLGSGYHLIQSRIAIGAGQIWGKGLHHGTQTQLQFIPEQHTDFIFSAVGEELGFVGCIAVLFVFWLICLRLVLIARTAKDSFGSLLAIGVLSMLVFQVLVNIGMTIGMAPVTGIPLPWVSYGRSAMLTNFIAIGLVESVANHRNRLKF